MKKVIFLTVAGKYLADIISVNIVNNPGNFQVFDRENLSGIAEANKLIAEGYIDVDKAKELGKLLSVEAIIIGNYTVLSNTIKLTTKALDANTGFVMAAAMKDLPLDGDAGALLGINISSNGTNNNSDANADNRGFNRPLNSNEAYNNPETVNKNCVTENTGDFCFTNGTNARLKVQIFQKGVYGTKDPCGKNSNVLILAPDENKCLYGLYSCAINYSAFKETSSGFGNSTYFKDYTQGQILVEQCKSKTLKIK